jgi:CheY-like chemotaxis protein
VNEGRNDKVNLSILYVEDELITRMTIHKILAARYTTIYLAQDGREGLIFSNR